LRNIENDAKIPMFLENISFFISPNSFHSGSTCTSVGLNSMLRQNGQQCFSVMVRPDSPGNRWRVDGLVSLDILANW
jgi:hypothetical protein